MITITEDEARQIADTLTREGWKARSTSRRFLTGWLVECSHPPEIPIPITVSDPTTARRMLRRISQPAFPAVTGIHHPLAEPRDYPGAVTDGSYPIPDGGFDAREDCERGEHQWRTITHSFRPVTRCWVCGVRR